MATFKVGDRVRIIGPAHSKAIGEETVITATDAYGQSYFDGVNLVGFFGYEVARMSTSPTWRGRNVFHGSCLEHIQPEGNRVVAWEDCLWRPEEMREGVT